MNAFQGGPEDPYQESPFDRPPLESHVSGIPKRKAMHFNGPDDAPLGVKFHKLADGYTAEAPLRDVGTGMVVFLAGFGSTILMLSSIANENISPVFIPIMGSLAALFFLVSTLYFFPRAKLSLDGEWLTYKVSLFGIRRTKRISLTQLKRLSLTKEQNMIGSIGFPIDRTRRFPQIRIETADRRWEFGKKLKDAHQQYFRYLIEYHYRQWKGKKAQ
jgi:hypothetical protein